MALTLERRNLFSRMKPVEGVEVGAPNEEQITEKEASAPKPSEATVEPAPAHKITTEIPAGAKAPDDFVEKKHEKKKEAVKAPETVKAIVEKKLESSEIPPLKENTSTASILAALTGTGKKDEPEEAEKEESEIAKTQDPADVQVTEEMIERIPDNDESPTVPHTTALYCRISKDDNEVSTSIENQKRILARYAINNGLINLRFYTDKSFSGTTDKRPAFQRMVLEAKQGFLDAVLVVDRSRLARNFIIAGELETIVFPENNVRFISVNEGYDSAKKLRDSSRDLINFLNQDYAEDVSEKIMQAWRNKDRKGLPVGTRPYGYVTDEDGLWVIDEETAPVVKKIFEDRMAGVNKKETAAYLTKNRVLRPMALKAFRNGKSLDEIDKPFGWTVPGIDNILKNPIYKGTVVNFQSHRVSFNSKKRVDNKPEDMSIHEGAVPAIIEKDLFDDVQKLNTKARRTIHISGKENPFSGLVFCADCGRRMHYRDSTKEHPFYTCSAYDNHLCTRHKITEDDLKGMVDDEVSKMIRAAVDNSAAFRKIILYGTRKADALTIRQIDDELSQITVALDIIDKRTIGIYQNKVDGVLKLEEYEATLTAFTNQRAILETRRAELEKAKEEGIGGERDVKSFIKICRKFDGQEITQEVIRAFIEKIYVHEGMPIDGMKKKLTVPEIEIEWRFIGKVTIPESLVAAYVRKEEREQAILEA